MVEVVNIMADGQVIKDLSGHVVKLEDNEQLYNLIENIGGFGNESKR